MKVSLTALALTAALAPLAGHADPRDAAGDGRVVVVASCADLRAEVAATRAECRPARAPAPAVTAPLTVMVDDAPAPPPRRIRALPWLIGVYN